MYVLTTIRRFTYYRNIWKEYEIMCLAVPLKLVEINGKDAVGEALGMRRAVRVDFIPDPKIGDYVMVHAGFAIERLPEEQAMDDLETWEELQHALG